MAIDPFFGSVLGAASNLVGGLFGQESQRKANETARENAVHQQNLQQEYAMKGITWRARDVMQGYKETGIHPLALLGVQGPTYSPVGLTQMGGSPIGEAIGRAGQDISKGIHATADLELRNAALAMQKERYSLENELLRTKIAQEQMELQRMANPAMPSPGVNKWLVPGQGDTRPGARLGVGVNVGNLIKDEAMKRTVSDPQQLHQEPGAVTSKGWLKNADGSWTPVRSKDATERLEDDTLGNLSWFFSNRVLPYFGANIHGPYKLPAHKTWYVDYKGDYHERPSKYRPVTNRGRGERY